MLYPNLYLVKTCLRFRGPINKRFFQLYGPITPTDYVMNGIVKDCALDRLLWTVFNLTTPQGLILFVTDINDLKLHHSLRRRHKSRKRRVRPMEGILLGSAASV